MTRMNIRQAIKHYLRQAHICKETRNRDGYAIAKEYLWRYIPQRNKNNLTVLV